MKYIYSKDDSVTPFIDSLDFDPLYWLGEDKTTMGQLFEMAQPCEVENRDDDEHYDSAYILTDECKSIRYMDNDVCFEILFECLDTDYSIALADDEWQNFYTDGFGSLYHISVVREL